VRLFLENAREAALMDGPAGSGRGRGGGEGGSFGEPMDGDGGASLFVTIITGEGGVSRAACVVAGVPLLFDV